MMTINTMCRIALAFAFALVLTDCGGLKIRPCLSDPANMAMQCNDSTGQHGSTILYGLTENYICLSPADARTLWSTCKQTSAELTICVSNPAAGGMECSDAHGHSAHLGYPQTDNFTCLSPDDARSTFEFCAVKARPGA
jgi:hypothetical protein